MFNYPYYNFPSYYPASSLSRGLLGGRGASSLFRGAAGKFSWNSFLTSTGKTLNVINQAIPIFYQVRPIFHNAKTMFKVLGAVKGSSTLESTTQNQVSDEAKSNYTENNTYISNTSTYNESDSVSENIEEGNPVFFL